MEKDKIKNIVVETYAEDMAEVIEGDKSGLIKKIIEGEERHEEEKKSLSPESAKNRFFLVAGSVLLVLAVAAVVIFLGRREAPTIPVEKQFVPLVFTDTSTSIEVAGLTKDKIAEDVSGTVKGAEVKTGGVEGIYLIENKNNVGLREFLSLIKSNFQPADSVISDNFLMGAVNSGDKNLFILLKVRSMADAFPLLRSYEEKMLFDLHGFFGVSVSGDNRYFLTTDFSDGIIQNKNARILYDKSGTIVLMYIFADENSIIITNTESAAQEVILRLAANQIKK